MEIIMNSTNIYSDQQYVVYHITYSGDKLPPNYIGSTSVTQINKGYMGSVCSKTYKTIWETELKENPHLFTLDIISYHDTRPHATWKELQIQQTFNVVKNPLFVNMSYAQKNGCFGRDVSGKNNPSFHNKSKHLSKEHKAKLSASQKGKPKSVQD